MPKHSYSDTRERHERLLGLLKTNDFWTTTELSRKLSISHRTLMRDIAQLRERGIPIESDKGRGGGISLNQRYGIGRLDLNYHEILSLLLSMAVLEKLKSPILGTSLKSIRDKIARSFPDTQRSIVKEMRKRILISEKASTQVLSNYQESNVFFGLEVQKAFFEKVKLRIEYLSEKGQLTQRLVEPHYLVLSWPVWYVLGWDDLREAVRFFRVDRIKKIEVTDFAFKLHHQNEFKKNMEAFFENI